MKKKELPTHLSYLIGGGNCCKRKALLKSTVRLFAVLLLMFLVPNVINATTIEVTFNASNGDLSAGDVFTPQNQTMRQRAYSYHFLAGGINVSGGTMRLAAWGDIGTGNAWRLTGNSLQNNQNTRQLAIVDLQNGDKVTLNFYGTPANYSIDNRIYRVDGNQKSYLTDGYALENGATYYVAKNGAWEITCPNSVYITKITIEREDNVSLEITETDASRRFDLKTIYYDEPTITYSPSTAIVEYTITGGIGKMQNSYPGDPEVLFYNTGNATVTATLTVGSTTISKSYSVEVWATPAEFTENGKRFTLGKVETETGEGKLRDKTITSIGGLVMNFGNPNEATVVINEEGHNVARTLSAVNGWRDKYPYSSTELPTSGTYYTFQTLSSGKLKVGGKKIGSANTVVLVKTDGNGNILETIDVFASDLTGWQESSQIQLEMGCTYYLFGNTPDGGVSTTGDNQDWAVFELNYFEFDSDFKLTKSAESDEEHLFGTADDTNKSSVADAVYIKNVASPTIESVEYQGHVQSADVTIVGNKLQFSNISYKSGGTGGAIKVTIGGAGTKDFVLTIPYGAHVWDFRLKKEKTEGLFESNAALVADMKANTTDWSRTYQLIRNPDGDWGANSRLEIPLMVNDTRLDGNNAFYMSNTAGLIFVTGTQTLGAKETANSIANYDPDNKSYNYYYLKDGNAVTEAELLMLKGNNGKIVFPGVKPGQYIKFYTYWHGAGDGSDFVVNNLQDLNGASYNSGKIRLQGLTDNGTTGVQPTNYDYYIYNRMTGAAIFKVPDTFSPTDDIDMLPSIALTDLGWTTIYRIEICDEYSSDLRLIASYLPRLNGENQGYFEVDYNNEGGSITVVRDKKTNTVTPVTRTYNGQPGLAQTQRGSSDYLVERVLGNVDFTFSQPTYSYWKNLEITVNGGYGILKVTQTEKDALGNFVISRNEKYIAVGEIAKQEYPYTWDFTNYNMYQGNSTTEDDLAATLADNYGNWSGTEGTFSLANDKTVGFSLGKADVGVPLFAQGSQPAYTLSSGIKPVAETEGLGIRIASETKTCEHHSNSAGTNTYYNYELFKFDDSQIAINGSTLQGAAVVTIPEVDEGMYVFVKASAAPAVTGAVAATKYDGHVNDFDLQSGVSVFKVSTTGDVVLTFADGTTIEKIGVTNQFKQIVNTAGKTTESRAMAIDYSQTEHFVNSNLHAYIAVDYVDSQNKQTGKLTLKELKVSPAETGLVLFTENTSGNVSNPLFVPACNNSEESTDGNLMKPNVTESSLPGSDADAYRYVLTNQFRLNKGEDRDWREGDYGFYKVNETGTLKANMAYLELNAEDVGYARQIVLFENPDYGTDGIEVLEGDVWNAEDDVRNGAEREAQLVFYTLGGTRLNGVPTEKGIYMVRSAAERQGRKVIVK